MTIEHKFTPNHAKHLAALVEALRPDWDHPGVADAIWQARDRGNAIEVCVAAIRACSPLSRTPAIIPLDGNHWREIATKPARGVVVDAVARCGQCGGFHHRLSPCDPPEAERSRGRGAGLARAALRLPEQPEESER